MTKDRDRLLEEKREALALQLNRWAQANTILQSGEQLVFSLTVQVLPAVIDTSNHPKLPGNFTARQVYDASVKVRSRERLSMEKVRLELGTNTGLILRFQIHPHPFRIVYWAAKYSLPYPRDLDSLEKDYDSKKLSKIWEQVKSGLSEYAH